MNKFFFISHQAALAVCKAEGLNFSYLKSSARPGCSPDALCLKTGAKISFCERDNSYMIYGYHYANEDITPYRKYERKANHVCLPRQ